MQGDDADMESAAMHAQDLQPSDEAAHETLAEPARAERRRSFSRPQQETQHHQESLDRRLADRELVKLLAQDGFAGPRYEAFEDDLARYAISVLRAWMHSGHIFAMAARRGFGLSPHDIDLERLATDSELREELATMTVALALPRFRQWAFVEGGWSFERGAAITTYFMGACLYCFPNEFRRHRTGEDKHRKALQHPHFDQEALPGVEAEVVGREMVRDALRSIDSKKGRERAIVALALDGYTQEEIRDILGESSVRAVEGVLHRWRKRAAHRRLAEGGAEHE
ncbi:hypothetical protein [Streptomyces sp. NPDC003832]